MIINGLPPGERRTVATHRIFLLVFRKETDSAVIFAGSSDPRKKNILFMNDPAVLKQFNNGEFIGKTFLAREVPTADGEELMNKAKTDGLCPLFANMDSNGEVTYGEIGRVNTSRVELV